MKNLKVFILSALGVSLLSSCKKDYQCSCIDTDQEVKIKFIEARSVKDAKDECGHISLTPEGNTCIYAGENGK